MRSYLTNDIPGTGGVIKETPEDFIVEEIPSYLPCGSGEHLYLTVEKRGITTLEAIRRIAGQLHIREQDIGYAGMKDAVGVTRQTISLQRIKPETCQGLELDGVKVIAVKRHTNKLKLGHLKGNLFRIAIRGTVPAAAASAETVLQTLSARGVPNYFGYQRYGAQGNSQLVGRAMLRNEWRAAVDLLIGETAAVRDEQWRSAIEAYRRGDLVEAARLMPGHCRTERDLLQRLAARPEGWERAFHAVHPRLKKLFLSAYQSQLFDTVVELRLAEIDRVMAGDLAWKHVNGACFLVEDTDIDNERARLFEISASGPLFGCKMKLPGGRPLDMEQALLDAEGLRLEEFDLPGGLRMEGERRPLRVPLGVPTCTSEGDCLRLEFSLPKGSYATSVVRELTKTF